MALPKFIEGSKALGWASRAGATSPAHMKAVLRGYKVYGGKAAAKASRVKKAKKK